MKQERFTDKDEWFFARRGKITGSRLKDIYSKRDPEKKKIGFYELIAEKLGLPPDDGESAMERGSRLEKDAIARFAEETGKAVDTDLILWMRDDNENIAISPDGVISPTEAVEAKCLSSARHIEAYLTKKIPEDYQMQAVQYFIVNDDLQLLHFVFFDPRFAMFRDPEAQKQNALGYFVIEVRREEVQAQVEEYLVYQRKVIAEVNNVVNQLTF
jgi:hypothetical protein